MEISADVTNTPDTNVQVAKIVPEHSDQEDDHNDTNIDTIRYKTDPPSVDETTGFNLVDQRKPDLRNLRYLTSTEHLNCPICQQPFIQPLTTICGHTFCKECIFECFKMSRDSTNEKAGLCPLDRTPIDSSSSNDLFPTPILINNLMDELKVYCLNSARGCEWKGCRWELEHHVAADCEHTGVKCKTRHDGEACEVIVERRFLTDCEECVHRLYGCTFCKQEICKVEEEHHLEQECLFNFQTCDLCSNDMIPMKSMAIHKEHCAKWGKFVCPASEIGCTWVGSNEPALENHLTHNCQLSQFLPFFKSMNNKMDELSEENRCLQKQINKILDAVIQGKVTNLGYSEPLEEINRFKGFGENDQDKLLYLSYEIDRLKYQIDEKLIPFVNKQTNEREPIVNNLISDNFMMKDDLNLQRMLINSLRKQIQFILFKNHRPAFGSLGGNPLEDTSDLSDTEERLNMNLKL